MRFATPPPLAPGDLVAAVAPSGACSRDDLWPGLAWVRDRYRVRATQGLLSCEGYLAGHDRRRSEELARAMVDPEVKAVLIVRGGYGVMRILGELPWDRFASAPKWIVGFSDATALHVEAWRRSIRSIHGPNIMGLGAASPRARAAWLAALEGARAPRVWRGLQVVRKGRAEGPLVGGNLALLEAMAAAGLLHVPEGAVLALEEVNERPYRLDRMLTALRLGGHLAHAAALVLGSFTRCEPAPDGVGVEEVLADRLSTLGVPVVAGAPFGHGTTNEAFVTGGLARLEGDSLTLE